MSPSSAERALLVVKRGRGRKKGRRKGRYPEGQDSTTTVCALDSGFKFTPFDPLHNALRAVFHPYFPDEKREALRVYITGYDLFNLYKWWKRDSSSSASRPPDSPNPVNGQSQIKTGAEMGKQCSCTLHQQEQRNASAIYQYNSPEILLHALYL